MMELMHANPMHIDPLDFINFHIVPFSVYTSIMGEEGGGGCSTPDIYLPLSRKPGPLFSLSAILTIPKMFKSSLFIPV